MALCLSNKDIKEEIWSVKLIGNCHEKAGSLEANIYQLVPITMRIQSKMEHLDHSYQILMIAQCKGRGHQYHERVMA